MADKTTAEVLKDWIIRTRGYYLSPKPKRDKIIAGVIFAAAIILLIIKFSGAGA
jgi:hypothetical protein